MRNSQIFPIFTVLLIFFLTSCKGNSTGPEDGCENGGPKCPPLPDEISMISPSVANTYWSDRVIPCQIGLTNVDDDDIEWLVGDEVVACTGGELDTQLSEGEYTITVRASAGGKTVQDTADITVNEGFSVSLDKPKSGAEFFVGDEVSCAATITPEKYEEYLSITVDGKDCTAGTARLSAAGQTIVRVSASIDNRIEAEEITVTVRPTVAGHVYPMTDRGVADKAGFVVYLDTPAQSYHTTTDADGRFHFPGVSSRVYEADELTIQVGETSDFYGARAELATYTPWTPDNDGVPISAGEQLLEITSADSLGFVLAPRRWQIRCGPYAGKSTTIKLPEAFKRNNSQDAGSSFYSLERVFGEYKYASISPQYRPLSVAFNEEEGSEDITAADSTAFWRETDEVFEPQLCRGNLFVPAVLEDVPTTADGVHVWAIGAEDGASSGHGSDDKGDLSGGWMALEPDQFGSQAQRHEMGHILGFGHTPEWVGTMSVGSFPGSADLREYSVDDVSHIQLYMDTFDLQQEEGISFGVYEWRQMFDIPSLPDN